MYFGMSGRRCLATQATSPTVIATHLTGEGKRSLLDRDAPALWYEALAALPPLPAAAKPPDEAQVPASALHLLTCSLPTRVLPAAFGSCTWRTARVCPACVKWIPAQLACMHRWQSSNDGRRHRLHPAPNFDTRWRRHGRGGRRCWSGRRRSSSRSWAARTGRTRAGCSKCGGPAPPPTRSRPSRCCCRRVVEMVPQTAMAALEAKCGCQWCGY